MELYFPCCYDAFPVPRAPSKNQRRADKPGSVPTRGARSSRRGAGAWQGLGWSARCLASVALLVIAACSSFAETDVSANYAVGGIVMTGTSPGSGDPTPASPTNAGNPTTTTDPDQSGE